MRTDPVDSCLEWGKGFGKRRARALQVHLRPTANPSSILPAKSNWKHSLPLPYPVAGGDRRHSHPLHLYLLQKMRASNCQTQKQQLGRRRTCPRAQGWFGSACFFWSKPEGARYCCGNRVKVREVIVIAIHHTSYKTNLTSTIKFLNFRVAWQ